MRKVTMKKNGRWQLRYLDNGKIRERSFKLRRQAESFAKLLAAAEADREHFSQMLAAGRVIGAEVPERPPARFEELAQAWREAHLEGGNLRPSTRKDYRLALKRLLEAFKGREVHTIKTRDIERARNAVVTAVTEEQLARVERAIAAAAATPPDRRSEAQGALLARAEELRAAARARGPRAGAKFVGCARTVWKYAVANELALRNVADAVSKPRIQRSAAGAETPLDENILTPGEFQRLLAAIPEQHRCAVRFLFATGVRLGELRGLSWADFDFASGRVVIRRQRSEMTGELTAPKTPAGTRWIDLDAELLTELKKLKLRSGAQAHPFAFDPRNWRTRVWAPALRRAGLRSIRVHDARHTSASWLIGAGADVVAVSRRLGHSNPSITLNTYSHAFARRSAAGLGEQLADFMRRETEDNSPQLLKGGRKVAVDPAELG